MFNVAGFNQMPFNRSLTVEIYGSFEIDLDLNVLMTGNLEIHEGFDISNELEVDLESIRERLGMFVIDQALDVEFDATRERYGTFEIQGNLDLQFEAGRYHVDHIEFTGQFRPGDRIVIDSNTLKMTINGQNALHLMKGDFFDLNTGSNELIYTDNQSGRTVRMRITHKDKFV